MGSIYVDDALRSLVDDERETLQDEQGGYVSDIDAIESLLSDDARDRLHQERENA